MAKRKHTKGQAPFYKTQHRKLKIKKYVPHNKLEMNSGAPVGFANPDSLMTTVVLLLSDTNNIFQIP
jgi:hypothetical protein